MGSRLLRRNLELVGGDASHDVVGFVLADELGDCRAVLGAGDALGHRHDRALGYGFVGVSTGGEGSVRSGDLNLSFVGSGLVVHAGAFLGVGSVVVGRVVSHAKPRKFGVVAVATTIGFDDDCGGAGAGEWVAGGRDLLVGEKTQRLGVYRVGGGICPLFAGIRSFPIADADGYG